MARQIVMLVSLVALLAGCATAAQRDAATIRDTSSKTVAEVSACIASINTNSAYADLSQHWPLADIRQASLSQLTDPTFATPREIEMLGSRHDTHDAVPANEHRGFQPCHSKCSECLPGVIREKRRVADPVGETPDVMGRLRVGRKGDCRRNDIQTGRSWWPYGADLAARNQQELAQRAAAAQAIAASMQQQQIINQNQQMINSINRPVMTNCTHIGISTNCTSY